MGANQIGYVAVLPCGKEASGLVKKYVDEFRQLLNKYGKEAVFLKHQELRSKDASLSAEDAQAKAEELIYDQIAADLKKLGLDTEYLRDFRRFETNEQMVQIVREVIDSLAGFNPNRLDYRDVSLRRDKINGHDVVIAFAGEMTWGDEPDGAGYTVLQALEITGLMAKLEDMIPGFNNKRRK